MEQTPTQRANALRILSRLQTEVQVPRGHQNLFADPQGKVWYRTIDDILKAVKPVLVEEKCALILTDTIVEKTKGVYVVATATLHTPDGPISSTGYAREVQERAKFDASQLTGSASTYARKTALCGLLAIDDGNDPDKTNDHGLSKDYMDRLQALVTRFDKKVIRVAMGDYKIERLSELPEKEYENFKRLCEGLKQSNEEGEL